MNVLSLFDGMSCGQIALERAGIKVDKYYASEIDKYAIQITQKNYPDTIQLGDVTKWREWDLPKIDLILAGSPCQGFSFAGKQLAFDDPRSKLFFDFVHILQYHDPKYYLLENVKMAEKNLAIITRTLPQGTPPSCVLINSALVSAQNRNRYYWNNFGFSKLEDKGIKLKDVVFSDAICMDGVNPVTFTEARSEESKRIRREVRQATGKDFSPRRGKIVVPRNDSKANCLTASMTIEHLILTDKAMEYMNRTVKGGRNHWDFKHHSDIRNEKSAAVVANFFKGVPYNVFKDWDCIRKFHPIECERLQTVPDNYTQGVSNTQRYKMLGNGWTVDVIAHILKGLVS